MARPLKENKLTARIGGARCTPEAKKALEDVARQRGFRGIWPMIWATFTGKKYKRLPSEQQEELQRDIAFLSDLFHAINAMPDNEHKENLLSLLMVEVKRKTDLYGNCKVEPARKHRRPD